jgi:hypothetical protein
MLSLGGVMKGILSGGIALNGTLSIEKTIH